MFGREGVFAANFWRLSSADPAWVRGALKMYLDYDGATGNGQFGDLSIDATSSDIGQSAVYASLDTDDPSRMVLVAINRTTAAKDVAMAVTHDRRFDLAEVYQLTGATALPVRGADIFIDAVNAFHYAMPAMSVTTLVLRSFAEGDSNLSGSVNGADLSVVRSHLGTTSGARFREGDNNRDGDVDGADFLAWQRDIGTGVGAVFVPEPLGCGGLWTAAAMARVVTRLLAAKRRR